jgi:hypothetical protein
MRQTGGQAQTHEPEDRPFCPAALKDKGGISHWDGDKNSCLSASVDGSAEMTVLLPMAPVKAATTTHLGTVAKVGLAPKK